VKTVKKTIKGIDRELLELIFAASRDTHPREFSSVLRMVDDVISEILPLPGTLAGKSSSLLHLHMLPIDRSVVGVVHSHPSPNFYPSDADKHLFSKFGFIHIICAYPYNIHSWGAYDNKGERVRLPVIEAEKEEKYYF